MHDFLNTILVAQQKYLFLSDQFTFLGVIATIAVLSVLPSLSKGKEERLSNFLFDLIRTYKRSIGEYFSKKIVELTERLDKIDKDVEEKVSELLRGGVPGINKGEDDKLDEIIIAKDRLSREVLSLKSEIREAHQKDSEILESPSYIEESTPTFISFFTFILCVVVMTIHCMPLPFDFSVSMLFWLDVLYSIIMLSSWIYYFVDWKTKNGGDVKSENKVAVKAYLFLLVFLIIVFLLHTDDTVRVIVLILFIIVASIRYYLYIKKKHHEKHYDNGSVAFMAIIGILCAIVFSFFAFLASNHHDLACVAVMAESLGFVQNNVQSWALVFIMLCVLNQLVLPLLISGFRYEVVRNMKFRTQKKEWIKTINEIENKEQEISRYLSGENVQGSNNTTNPTKGDQDQKKRRRRNRRKKIRDKKRNR